MADPSRGPYWAVALLADVIKRLRSGLPVRGDAVPAALQETAEVAGFPGVRYRTEMDIDTLTRDVTEAAQRERAYLRHTVLARICPKRRTWRSRAAAIRVRSRPDCSKAGAPPLPD